MEDFEKAYDIEFYKLTPYKCSSCSMLGENSTIWASSTWDLKRHAEGIHGR